MWLDRRYFAPLTIRIPISQLARISINAVHTQLESISNFNHIEFGSRACTTQASLYRTLACYVSALSQTLLPQPQNSPILKKKPTDDTV
jgi:hypothetical protein